MKYLLYHPDEIRQWIKDRPGCSIEFAKHTGMSYTWVRNFANDIIKNPRINTIILVSKYIDWVEAAGQSANADCPPSAHQAKD